MVAFPLSVHSSGRYLVDANGVPFRIHGEASWDAHINLSTTDLQTYVTDRAARGTTALFTYTCNPIEYYAGSSAPYSAQLGGSGAGASALPFLLNKSGGAWNGDPTFANFDAAFSSPNDAYFATVASFVDICATAGIVVCLCPMYLGFNSGAEDGWYQTLVNSVNTSGVCNTFGQYLATGHGTFTGFASRKNIIWIMGGDTLPANGGTAATRSLSVLQGLQTGGANQLVGMHWQHDFLPNDQTDPSGSLTVYNAYTHGALGSPPVLGPTYAESRQIYGSQSPSRPTFLLETTYWGDGGATRANVRFFQWAAALSCIGGSLTSFSPFWGFATSADGTTGAPTAGGTTTAWIASTVYTLNEYASHGSKWYRCTVGGTSAGSGGPTGTGTSISDGSVTWTYVAAVSASMAGMANLLSEGGVIDMQVLGQFMQRRWWTLIPSALSVMSTLVTNGQGTYATWSDGNPESGGMDWITSASATDGSLVVAYVPSAHSGAFTVVVPSGTQSIVAYLVDPNKGSMQYIGSLAGGIGQSFTVPGNNAGGDADWVLLMEPPSVVQASSAAGC